MKLELKRVFLGKKYTIGKLYVDGVYFCDTLEDTVRKGAKVWGQTAIPAGAYKMILSMSQRFRRVLPLLLNVANFTGIRMHGGTTEVDTHGCLLVGINAVKGKLLKSQITLAKLLAILDNSGLAEFEIIITNP